MVVVGQMSLIYQFDKKFIKPLSRNFAWLAEHLSNQTIPALPIKNFDVAISGMDEERQEQMTPDLLITYGGHIVSKQLKKYLRTHRPKEHWLLDTSLDEVYWPCSHSRAIPSFPSQLEWKIGLAWASTDRKSVV